MPADCQMQAERGRGRGSDLQVGGRTWRSTLPRRLLGPYLHHVDKVKEELLGILLSVGGELGVTLANEGLEHPRGDAILNFLGRARAANELGLKRPTSETSPRPQ